ncbi:MAG: hypothetical protein WCJ62_13250 [Flavobacterium sp.]
MKKYLYVFISMIIISCNYNKDKLNVQNNTEKDIWFIVMCKNKIENKYYFTQIQSLVYSKELASGVFQVFGTNNKSCEKILKNRLYDKKLYIVFFDPKETGPIEDINPNLVFNNKKIIVKMYTKKELDDMDWIVEYDGK